MAAPQVNPALAAQRWRDVWEDAWPRGDAAAIAALYAPAAEYRALAFRDPDRGTPAILRYLQENAQRESAVTCRFGPPVVQESRAAIEWWASWDEGGARITMAGTTLLVFDEAGLVVDHRDYWNDEAGEIAPYDGWLVTSDARR